MIGRFYINSLHQHKLNGKIVDVICENKGAQNGIEYICHYDEEIYYVAYEDIDWSHEVKSKKSKDPKIELAKGFINSMLMNPKSLNWEDLYDDMMSNRMVNMALSLADKLLKYKSNEIVQNNDE